MATFEIEGVRYPWFGRMPEYLWRKLRQFIFQRDAGRCQYCTQPVELVQCHIHHTLELNQGGTNHPSNLKVLCKPCHKNRHPFMKTASEKLRDGEVWRGKDRTG
jgi:5-methylcytosine-specific restriction protein A